MKRMGSQPSPCSHEQQKGSCRIFLHPEDLREALCNALPLNLARVSAAGSSELQAGLNAAAKFTLPCTSVQMHTSEKVGLLSWAEFTASIAGAKHWTSTRDTRRHRAHTATLPEQTFKTHVSQFHRLSDQTCKLGMNCTPVG